MSNLYAHASAAIARADRQSRRFPSDRFGRGRGRGRSILREGGLWNEGEIEQRRRSMKASERDATAEECRGDGKTKRYSPLSRIADDFIPPPLPSTAYGHRPSGPPVECPLVSEERVRPAERAAVLALVAFQRRFHVRPRGDTVPLELVFPRIPPLAIMAVPVRA